MKDENNINVTTDELLAMLGMREVEKLMRQKRIEQLEAENRLLRESLEALQQQQRPRPLEADSVVVNDTRKK